MIMPHPPHDTFHEPEDTEDAAIFQSASEDGTKIDAAHEDVQPTEPVELNLADPHFMANAYDTYADLRSKGPVSRVRFVGGDEEEAPGDSAKEQRPEVFFGGETFFVTHYDEALATLLDDRFSVDPRSAMSREELEQQPPMPEEFRLFSRSILALDPPDHTRLRKLVQPSFTGRGMQAMRGSIQQIADDLLNKAERDAAGRGEEIGRAHV